MLKSMPGWNTTALYQSTVTGSLVIPQLLWILTASFAATRIPQKLAPNATAATVTTDFMQKSLRPIFHGEIFKRFWKYLSDDL